MSAVSKIVFEDAERDLLDWIFSETKKNTLDFNDKFLLAKKICACKLPIWNSFEKELEEMVRGLHLEEELKVIATTSQYLIFCNKIISLGGRGISPNFFKRLIQMEREGISLNFKDRLTLINNMSAVSTMVFEYAERDLFEWVFENEMKELKKIFGNKEKGALNLQLFAMREKVITQKNSEWVLKYRGLFDVIDPEFSIDQTIQAIEMWSDHGDRAISSINQLMDKTFMEKLAKVEPFSLRYDYFKKLIHLLGESFAVKIIKNFQFLNLEDLEEEEYHTLFLLLVSQGSLAGEELIPHLKKIKNLDVKLLLYRQATSYGEKVFKKLLENHESFSGNTPSLFEYMNRFARQGLDVMDAIGVIRFCKDKDMKNIACLEILIADPDAFIKEEALARNIPIVLRPFLTKKANEITQNDKDELSKMVVKDDKLPIVFKEVFKNIQNEKNKLAQYQLLKWYAYVLVMPNKNMQMINDFLPLICEYQSPVQRFDLTRQLFQVKELCLKPSEKIGLKPKIVEEFSRLLLSRCVELGLPQEQAEQLYGKIIKQSSNTFKDTKNAQVLIKVLTNVISNSPFTKKELLALTEVLGKILGNEDRKQVIKELQMFNSILNVFGRQELLSCVENYADESAEKFFLQKFQKALHLNFDGDFTEAYSETFGKFRHPHAIFTYLGSINQLPLGEKEVVLNALATYVEGVLSGKDSFIKLRYNTDNGRFPHLEKIFKEQPTIHESWLDKGKTIDLSEYYNENKEGKEGYTIGESDDPEDLLQIGTEVTNSCQTLDGDPRLNKSLLGYILHGDVRPIVIKQDGRIVARSLLRLLWDETKKTAV